MPTYSAPIRDTRFILEKLLKIEQYTNLPGFAEASPDIVAAVLEEGAFRSDVIKAVEAATLRARELGA